jgi:hypothetical protein
VRQSRKAFHPAQVAKEEEEEEEEEERWFWGGVESFGSSAEWHRKVKVRQRTDNLPQVFAQNIIKKRAGVIRRPGMYTKLKP